MFFASNYGVMVSSAGNYKPEVLYLVFLDQNANSSENNERDKT